jgi:hypothetical protein
MDDRQDRVVVPDLKGLLKATVEKGICERKKTRPKAGSSWKDWSYF